MKLECQERSYDAFQHETGVDPTTFARMVGLERARNRPAIGIEYRR